jgi:hypothetical protein
MRQHLSYANVMATVAMFIALGGGSYAAIKITGKNVKNGTLTGADVRNGSLSGSDIRAEAINSDDVADGSLRTEDFTAGQLPRGPKGDRGPTGTVDTSRFYDKAQSDTRFLAATGKATDADKLDGIDSTAFLTEEWLSGRINAVPGNAFTFGAASGTSVASTNLAEVETLTPNVPLVATAFAVKTTGVVGPNGMNVYLEVNGSPTNLACHVSTSAGCVDDGSVTIPAASKIAVQIANCCDPSPGALLVAVSLRRG